jgi:integrase
LFDRYLLQRVPELAVTTQEGYRIAIAKLRPVFGEMQLRDVKPAHVYRYVDKRTRKVSAHREVEVLSAAFLKAVEWGELDRHPFKGDVRLEGEAPRKRYLEDWEVAELFALKSRRAGDAVPIVQAYLRLKLLTPMRQGDLLRLTMASIKDDGIHVDPHKTAGSSGKRTVYTWSDELRAAVDQAKAVRPALSPFLFCTRRGKGYMNEMTGRAPGWKSMWQRFQARVMAETKIVERFTEHDLRAKVGSDADSVERARALLSHADPRITERVYRRRAERVAPAK